MQMDWSRSHFIRKRPILISAPWFFLIKHIDLEGYRKALDHDISFQFLNEGSSDPFLINANVSVGFWDNKKRIWALFTFFEIKTRSTATGEVTLKCPTIESNWV